MLAKRSPAAGRPKLSVSLAIAGVAAACGSGALAHHSRAHYSRDVTEMVGEIVAIDWGNPHVHFRFRTTDENGGEQNWLMEAGSIYVLTRSGVTRDLFEEGQRVRVAGNVSTTRPGEFYLRNVLLRDGREIIIAFEGPPRWSEAWAGGRDRWAADADRLLELDGRNTGFFQVWSVPKVEVRQDDVPLTDAAIAARAAWNPNDNFVMRCQPPGMPNLLNGTQPHPFELVDQGDSIRFVGEEFDIVRTFHLRDDVPEDAPESPLGYSIAHWEGDNTLIVETSRIDWPYFDRFGTPQSDQVRTVERFTLSDGGRALTYHITITDPSILSGPATTERRYLALGETVEPYECEPYVTGD